MSSLLQSCAQVSRNISESQEISLPLAKKIGMTLHLAVCRHCRRFLRQIRFLHVVFHDYPNHLSNEHLSETTRQKIIEELKRRPGQGP